MKWLALAAVALLLQACGGGGSSSVAPAAPPVADASACPVADQRASLRSFMDNQYFWYTGLAAPNEAATSMDAYFQSMLYRPTDRYSFTQPSVAFNQIFTDGRRIGYGYAVVWADAAHSAMRVRNVEPRSPVAQAGLARGDIVVSINGYSPDAIAGGQAGPVTEAGIERTFVVRNAAGVQRVLRVQSADYPLTPVVTATTFDAVRDGAPVKVGYLAYNQFVQYSSFDLYNAFAQFAAAGAGELILDLRYNGGGSVAVSRDLASMIAGDRTGNLLYAYLRFNDKNRAMNISVVFNRSVPGGTPFPMPAGVPRLLVIGSAATASASELIINGLRPFMPVVLVGETTYGKP
jgi:carboxyl-terminal processing protease